MDDGRTPEDRALVTAVLGGEPGAFERLVREYQGLCWHIVQRMVRHPEDARELCQEAFLRVHQCLHQYRFDAPLKAWIGQVAYSVARRHLERKRIPIADSGGDEEGAPLHERVADEFDLESSTADAQVAQRLHAAIERLPPLQRTILTLYHLDELPLAQIARITGLAEGTLKSHLFRSRKRLQEWLAPGMGSRRMNKPTDQFDEREWRLQERALREERLASADSGDAGLEAYRKVVRALREPMHEALPADFAKAVAAQAARLPARGDSVLERWLVRALVAVFVASALYIVASDGGQWLRASLSLLPAADAAAVRNWGLALGACLFATWAFGRLRDGHGHATR